MSGMPYPPDPVFWKESRKRDWVLMAGVDNLEAMRYGAALLSNWL
jgi:hypothetical protein